MDINPTMMLPRRKGNQVQKVYINGIFGRVNFTLFTLALVQRVTTDGAFALIFPLQYYRRHTRVRLGTRAPTMRACFLYVSIKRIDLPIIIRAHIRNKNYNNI